MEPKVQIPPELVATVAQYVADENPAVAQYVADENPAFKSKTLTSCMLVSKTFAKEFRPFVFEVLHINDYERPQQALGHIKLCRDLLRQRPEYAPMVKRVVIGMSYTLILPQGSFAIRALGDLLGRLSSVSSVVVGGATPALIFDFEHLGISLMDDFDRAISRLCNLPTITTLSFDGCVKIPSTALIRAPHFQQVTLQDAIFCNSFYKYKFDPSYLADGFHLILRGRVVIPDDTAPLLSRVKKLSLYVGLPVDVYKKVIGLPLSSGYLRTLDITIRGADLGLEKFVLNLSEGKTLQHIHYTFTSTKYECLKSQEINAQIFVNIICSLPPLSAVETITITLRGVISAEDLREDAVQNAWKELDSVLSNSRRFPALQRVDLDVAYDISKTKAAEEILALKAVANSMLGTLSDKVLTVSVYALEEEV